MKKLAISILVIIHSININAQSGTESRDTVKLILGGESIILPMPKEGNKVTVNLEDSSEIIQVSIGRVNKFKSNTILNSDRSMEDVKPRKSHINWLREIELGTVSYLSRNYNFQNDSSIGNFFSNYNITVPNITSLTKISPEKVYPGITVGFNIKEKSRPIKNTKLEFITGFKFRYVNFYSKGKYEIVNFKYKLDSGVWHYYPDSIVSINKGDYRASTNFYHLVFPFLLETGLKNSKYKIAAGLNLMIGFSKSKIISSAGENLRNTQTFVSYSSPQIMMIQPSIRLSKNRFSLQLTTTLTKNTMGFGPTFYRTGNLWFLNLGYKIY